MSWQLRDQHKNNNNTEGMAIYGTSTELTVRVFFFSSRRRHTRLQGDWSSDVCSSDLFQPEALNFRIVAAAYDRGPNSSDAHRAQLQLTLPEYAALSIADRKSVV